MEEKQSEELTQEQKFVSTQTENEPQKQGTKEKRQNMPPLLKNLLIGILVVIILLFLLIVIAIATFEPNTGYATKPITIETSSGVVEYSIADPVGVTEGDNNTYKVYNKNNDVIGTVPKSDIAFEGTPEYEKAKKDRIEYDSLQKQLKEEQERKLAQELQKLEQDLNKAFYKIDMQPDNYICDFYIDPIAWQLLQFDEKENIFKSCAVYVFKKYKIDKTKALVCTKIKSSSNGEVLAQYGAFNGIKVK